MAILRQFSLFFAWLIAVLATTASLYSSEVLGFEPCPLCWIQRIALFPLVIILGLAAYRKDPYVTLYVFPQVLIGLGTAGYQYFYSTLAFYLGLATPICKPGEECFSQSFEFLGFITFPFLSLLVFTVILFMLIVSYLNRYRLN